MINEISIENFKSFKKLDDLRIKPITIFCGTNSCGKSTLLQSILSIKQTIESQANNQAFLSNGKYVHLGSFENLVYEKKKDNIVKFKFIYNLDTFHNLNLQTVSGIPFRYLIKEIVENTKDEVLFEKTKIIISLSFKSIASKKNKVIRPIRVLNYSIHFETPLKTAGLFNESNILRQHITFRWIKGNRYSITWKNISAHFSKDTQTISGNTKANCAFNNLIPKIQLTSTTDSNNISNLHFFFYRYKELLQALFTTYSYIGPLREEASRRYVYEDEVTEIGLKGENSAYLYITEYENQIKNHYFYNNDQSDFEKKDLTVGKAVDEWLNIMGIEGFGSDVKDEMIHLNLNANKFDETKINIADVGFGISQIFPIVLEGLRMSKQQTLLLEQPEIHLHPKLQMQMADYFISLALSQKNVIVETHSEHIINRLVRRIVEDENNRIQDFIAIYFLQPGENGAKIQEIDIDPIQGVVNWPKDFFDQTASEQEKIILAGLNKRRQKIQK
ncbi:hypothetical protein YH65_08850 [Sulfurovum lithotrophicum]|uniref:Endonuclease GajA/Old nuclease/RecF-like AAA domain-containing protein n=1 Tax=Sulfurovum lithotrophicum TaxID=206403 RepID=A0A7U4RR49_9BACT|nr:AAA family ATPase [Sulfurovum lithotrophicum]AKF25470.1 hypothetical protein YH65_08850 [Sulfurovum lithotrophicum]